MFQFGQDFNLIDCIQVYGVDFLGRDVVRGYGSALVPLSNGVHVIDVETYVPIGSSVYNNWIAWLYGTPAEVERGLRRTFTRCFYCKHFLNSFSIPSSYVKAREETLPE